ncbi:MAG: hypothetical protein ACKO0Z_27970 [Betaproteobacteria bacterium]
MSGSVPRLNILGVNDISTVSAPVAINNPPKHCPKFWILAPKGKAGAIYHHADQIKTYYGDGAFDPTGPFYTHQNHFLQAAIAKANDCEVERLIPPDAPQKANLCVWLDVLPMQVPLYQLNADGTQVLDANGLPIPVAGNTKVSGYSVKVVVDSISGHTASESDSTIFGQRKSKAGNQASGGTTSTRYPLIEVWATGYGSYYNNVGFKLVAPNTSSSVQPLTQVMNGADLLAFMYRLIAINRPSAGASPQVVSTVDGSPYVDFCLKPGGINALTSATCYLGDIFTNAFNQATPGYTPVEGDLSNIKIYETYIKQVQQLLYTTEKANVTAGSDISATSTKDESYKINLFTARSTSNVPYVSVILNTSDADAVNIGESTNIYLQNGGDGTVASGAGGAYFDQMVATAVTKYADKNSREASAAVSPGNVFYDSGFSLSTKYALLNACYRHDAIVYASTYTVGGIALTMTMENAIAASLASRSRLIPESTFYGTDCFRVVIGGFHGKSEFASFVNGLDIPAETYQLLIWNCALMGASSGNWKPGNLYDNGQNDVNLLTAVSHLNVDFVGALTLESAWNNALNVPEPRNANLHYIGLPRTVYTNETSVLMTNLNAHICAQLQEIGRLLWVEFRGSLRYASDDQFIDAYNARARELTDASVFAGLATVTPVTTITGASALTGYTWDTNFEVQMRMGKTVNNFTISAMRAANTTTTS